MKTTIHNFNDDVAKKMIEKLIQLIENKYQVKIEYEIEKIDKTR